MTPKVLLVSTSRWVSTARLATAMAREGCAIAAVCPRQHPVSATRAARDVHVYRAAAPLRSIAAAIAATAPDFVIPCDDQAVIHLHRFHERATPARRESIDVRGLLERSLGPPMSFPIVRARSPLIRLATELGVRAPATAPVRSARGLLQWLREHGLPAVLKADGTTGGRGVRVVRTPQEAVDALAALSAPPSIARALKRALVNRDTNYLAAWARRSRPVVNAQAFVDGRDANCTVACRHGRVLARITVEVLQTTEPNGPASVVRLLDHPEVDVAVKKIVSHLGLSGFVGFDFLLEEGTGDPYLIEMNPRATQTGHLQLGPGRDLAGSLAAVLSGEPRSNAACVTSSEIVAYFPQEWLRDAHSPFLTSGYHDVPWDEPALIRVAVADPFRARVWSRLMSMAREVGVGAHGIALSRPPGTVGPLRVSGVERARLAAVVKPREKAS